MENKSIWQYDIDDLKYKKLDKNIRCDILIIGGGIAGLSSAYFFRDSKYKTVLVERRRSGSGISSMSTGKLTCVQNLIYNNLKNNYDDSKALLYLNSQKDAIDIVKDIIESNNIDCDYMDTSSYVFTNDKKKIKDMEKEIVFYRKNNIKCDITDIPTKYPSIYSFKVEYGGVFNPVKYLMKLRDIIGEKIDIYENTDIIKLKKKNDYYKAYTDSGNIISSKYVIVCTHYPFFIVPFFLPFKSSVEKSYLVCGECKENDNMQLISDEVSFRYYKLKNKNYFIYGRCSHKVSDFLDDRDSYNEILDEFKKYFNGNLKCYWLNHDIMSYDGLPYIGEVDDNLYIACGFNKWGNTNGTIAGKVIYDIIMKNDNPYIGLFNPRRSISFNKVKNLFIYNFSVMKRYILNKIVPLINYYDDSVSVKLIDGKLCGIYIDENKNKHIVSNICPHMKCNLIFNYIDKTWDCPCHGSRFDVDGNLIFGPSVYDIKIDKK